MAVPTDQMLSNGRTLGICCAACGELLTLEYSGKREGKALLIRSALFKANWRLVIPWGWLCHDCLFRINPLELDAVHVEIGEHP